MPSLRRSLPLWMFLAVWPFMSRAGSAESAEPPPVQAKIFRVPPGAIPGNPARMVIDARPYLTDVGVPFPEAGFARFFTYRGLLFVRAPQESLDLIGTLLEFGCDFPPRVIRNEFTIVSFTLTDSETDEKTSDLDVLRKTSGASWHVLGVVQSISRIGSSLTSSFVQGGKNDPASLSNDAPGNTCKVEAISGPDGISIDSVIDFRFRSAGKDPVSVQFSGSVPAQDGRPKIIHWQKNATGDGSAIALIYRATQMAVDNESTIFQEEP